MRWTFRLPPPISDIASADIDADGHDELLCGAGDGALYALEERDGNCNVLWRLQLGSQVLSPVIADLNGDGTAEILVATSDGRMHCLGQR